MRHSVLELGPHWWWDAAFRRKDAHSTPHHCPKAAAPLSSPAPSEWGWALAELLSTPESLETQLCRANQTEEMGENYSPCTAASAGSTGQAFLELIFSFIISWWLINRRDIARSQPRRDQPRAFTFGNKALLTITSPGHPAHTESWDVKSELWISSAQWEQPDSFGGGTGGTLDGTPGRCSTPSPLHRLNSTAQAR